MSHSHSNWMNQYVHCSLCIRWTKTVQSLANGIDNIQWSDLFISITSHRKIHYCMGHVLNVLKNIREIRLVAGSRSSIWIDQSIEWFCRHFVRGNDISIWISFQLIASYCNFLPPSRSRIAFTIWMWNAHHTKIVSSLSCIQADNSI